MSETADDPNQLRHELRNVLAERDALHSMLAQAADRLEAVTEEGCSEEALQNARRWIEKYRRVMAAE